MENYIKITHLYMRTIVKIKSVAHSLILIRAKFSVASKFINVYRSVIVLYTWVLFSP